jgi:hypothetical protein
MEIIVLTLSVAVVLGYGAAYISIRRLRRAVKVQTLLGVVAPQKPQDAPESIKTVRKVK